MTLGCHQAERGWKPGRGLMESCTCRRRHRARPHNRRPGTPPPHDLITWQESDCHVMGRSAFTLSERVLIKLAPNITKKSRNSRGYSDFEPLESPSCRTRFRRFFSRPRVRFETEPRIHGWMPSHSATDRISIQVNAFRPADAGYTLLYISFKIVAERCRSSLCPSSGRNVTMPVPINTLLSCSSKCRT